MSGSKTTIADEKRLDNVHPGDILREDFLIGREIPLHEVVAGSGVKADTLRGLIDSKIAVDAETDLRLARYFGVSEGFFLGLQNDYDLEETRDAKREELDQIIRRAA